METRKTAEQIKALVRDKYAEIAKQDRDARAASCCGSACCPDEAFNLMAEEYQGLEGYVPDADLGLGCGLPTEYTWISEGDTVVDLGSGAGNDCFVARTLTGETGRVIGIDFTPEMIEKARDNADRLGYGNVEFMQGDIERLPLPDDMADVVISNCVLNLVPDKQAAFYEICRILKPGGHFCLSDIVTEKELPAAIREAADMYAGCISGASTWDDYFELIRKAGFIRLKIQARKDIFLPDDILKECLSPEEIAVFRVSGPGIRSITLTAEKPEQVFCACHC